MSLPSNHQSKVSSGELSDARFPRNVSPVAAIELSKPGATILLVEDDGELRELTRLLLQDVGYRVLTADSAFQALSVWDRNHRHIDLLIADMMIPNCTTGSMLARKLVAQKPELKVLYTSGFGEEIGADDTQFQRRSAFLQKPYTADALIKSTAQCLQDIACVDPGW
jgi:DNA-binding NtrC family response regulator